MRRSEKKAILQMSALFFCPKCSFQNSIVGLLKIAEELLQGEGADSLSEKDRKKIRCWIFLAKDFLSRKKK